MWSPILYGHSKTLFRHPLSEKNESKPVRVKLALNHRGKSCTIPTEVRILPNQWDKMRGIVKAHPQKTRLNKVLLSLLTQASNILYDMKISKDLHEMSVVELSKELKSLLFHSGQHDAVSQKKDTLQYWFEMCLSHKRGRTHSIYLSTHKRLISWLGEPVFKTVKLNDISSQWLHEFDDFMAITSPSANSRSIHMRNLRAVINFAIDNDATQNYPFRRFKIKSAKTRKRSLDLESIRRIFNYTCEEQWQQRYLDAFKISFMLIGMNVVDMCKLDEINHGRIEYERSKTKRIYDIKVEKEVLSLINKYKGDKHLLNYMDTCKNYRYFYNRLSKCLRDLCPKLGVPELTTYYARHTWATIASYIGISHDIISKSLGHGGNTVTDIYINFDMSKVDDANRKVLDYVLYDKLPN